MKKGCQVMLCVLILFYSGLLSATHGASADPGERPVLISGKQESSNSNELEEFIDSFFKDQMNKLHVPGAVFVMVKDGRIFFKKGYGFADVDKRTPVDPDSTVFRVASNSKLFVATAMMQLAERGKLNLRDDVNMYLDDFKVPRTWPAPVTIWNLLTHTAGFDDVNLKMSTSTLR